MLKKSLVCFLLLFLAGCSEDLQFDLDGYTTLSGSRTGGVDLCDGTNPPFQVTITKGEEVTASGSYQGESFGPVSVDSSTLSEIEHAMSEIPEKDCVEDDSVACDYCAISTLEVDDASVGRECCGDQNTDFEEGFDTAHKLFRQIAEDAN